MFEKDSQICCEAILTVRCTAQLALESFRVQYQGRQEMIKCPEAARSTDMFS